VKYKRQTNSNNLKHNIAIYDVSQSNVATRCKLFRWGSLTISYHTFTAESGELTGKKVDWSVRRGTVLLKD